MKINGKLNKKPVTLAITLIVASPTKIYLRAYDKDFPKTMYTDRYGVVQNEETFYIRMPISPENVVVEISKNPYFDKMGDGGFKVLDIKPLPLKKKLGAFNSASPVVKNFVAFAQEFSKRANYISAKGSIYTSNDGQFQIDYLDEIRDENGMALNTPARINKSTAVIQVSKSKFEKFTVPMRMAILLHEFSHYYLNGNIANETEADLNALLIYLGLGYPRIDAYNVFTKVFETSNNDENIKRMKIIDEFIRNFERKYVDMTYDSGSLYENYI